MILILKKCTTIKVDKQDETQTETTKTDLQSQRKPIINFICAKKDVWKNKWNMHAFEVTTKVTKLSSEHQQSLIEGFECADNEEEKLNVIESMFYKD